MRIFEDSSPFNETTDPHPRPLPLLVACPFSVGVPIICRSNSEGEGCLLRSFRDYPEVMRELSTFAIGKNRFRPTLPRLARTLNGCGWLCKRIRERIFTLNPVGRVEGSVRNFMKTYWNSLAPVWQHLHVFFVAGLAVLLVPLMTGSRPSEQEYLMALGTGLAACFGLQIPAPRR